MIQKKKCLQDIEEHFEEYALVDQDALNKMFYAEVEILPWEEYNCPCVPLLSSASDKNCSMAELGKKLLLYSDLSLKKDFVAYDLTAEFHRKASIIHFCTSQKPWRDREFYEQENMQTAMKIYQRYERIYSKVGK